MLRKATFEDADAIEALISDSVMRLQAGEYTLEQRQGALGTVFGLDRLTADRRPNLFRCCRG